MSDLPKNLKDELLLAIARERSSTRTEGTTRFSIGLGLALVLILGVALQHGLPEPSPTRPFSYLLISVAVALTAALLATRWTLTAGGSSLGRSRSFLRRLVWLVPATLAFGALLANASAPETWALAGRDWPAHRICVLIYVGLGCALLGIALFGLRPLDPIAPRLTGAALGAAVGAWTTLAVSLQCPSADPTHVLGTHVAPGLLLIALGVGFGRHALGFRYRRQR